MMKKPMAKMPAKMPSKMPARKPMPVGYADGGMVSSRGMSGGTGGIRGGGCEYRKK